MQVIVTSYMRPKYLEPTLASLKAEPGVELYVADGGGGEGTLEIIERYADDYVLLEGNPGADVLKNTGVETFGTEDVVVVTSDDLTFPVGFSPLMRANWEALNRKHVAWAMIACNTDQIERRHPGQWVWQSGIEIIEVKHCMVAGAMIWREAFDAVGGFPVYGRSGQGDWAFSRRLHRLGYRKCYTRAPMITHIGKHKKRDYPEYAEAFQKDEQEFMPLAKQEPCG